MALVVLLATFGCAESGPIPEQTPNQSHPTAVPVTSPDGMVVSGSEVASRIGADMLEAGGNAADAAVAAAFALAVVEPSMSGLGGRTQILLRTSAGEFKGIDATTVVPASYDPALAESAADGYQTIGVPGTVAGLVRLSSEYGRLPLAEVVQPSVVLAESGFELSAAEAARIASVQEALRASEGARTHFLQATGEPYQAGARMVQPDLAATLRAIQASGAAGFYEGAVARRMSEDILAHDGHVTLKDLSDYRALDALVVRGSYRGHTLVATFMPASGATTIEALQILDQLPLRQLTPSERGALVGQALLLAFEDREAPLGPLDELADLLTSRDWAATRALDLRRPGAVVSDSGSPTPPNPGPALPEPAHTTHLSVADRDGMLVSLTQSVGPVMGSRVATPGLGFIYAQTLGGYLASMPPGSRAWSSISPMMVLDGEEPMLVLGGAGARRIISALVQVISGVVDLELPLDAALEQARLHPQEDRWILEDRPGVTWPGTMAGAVEELGFEAVMRSDPSYFARINAIRYHPDDGIFEGVPDPRWPEGSAMAPQSTPQAAEAVQGTGSR